jgi:hypothetical protein
VIDLWTTYDVTSGGSGQVLVCPSSARQL